MNTETVIAPVTSSVTAPVTVTTAPALAIITNQDVLNFCAAIRAGAPSSGILPLGVSELKKLGMLTVPQQDAIKNARKEHAALVGRNSAMLFRLARSRQMKGARFNSEAELTTLRFGTKKAVKTSKSITAFPLYSAE